MTLQYVALILAMIALLYSSSQQKEVMVPIVVPMPQQRPVVVDKKEPTVVYLDKNAGKVPETYEQVGYLTGGTDLVPLYGKRSESRRGRWFYYAIVKDTKVPVFVEGRDCMREVACDEIYDGSSVVVPDIDPNASWKVKVYGNERRI